MTNLLLKLAELKDLEVMGPSWDKIAYTMPRHGRIVKKNVALCQPCNAFEVGLACVSAAENHRHMSCSSGAFSLSRTRQSII